MWAYDFSIAGPDPSAAPSHFTDAQLSAWAAEPTDANRVMTQALADVREALAPLEADYGELDLFVQGGYANRTAVTAQSDVDIVVRWLRMPVCGEADDRDGYEARAYRRFRDAVVDALRSRVDRGLPDPRIACRCELNTGHVDVVPCLPYRPAAEPGRDDIWLWPDPYYDHAIISWPKLIHTLIDTRDQETCGRFRPVVRALKGLRDELSTGEDKVPGFVIESLAFVAGRPPLAAPTIRKRCQAVLAVVRDQLLDDEAPRSFTDASERTPLFGVIGASSPPLDAAQGFLEEVWHRLG